VSKKTSPLLINEPPLQVLPSLAVAIGLNEAIIVQQIHYWLGRSNNVRNGRKWVYKSYPEWQEEFPFWSLDTIGRNVRKLEAEDIILSTDKYNQAATDRTKWYSIDYDMLALRAPQLATVDHGNLPSSRALQNAMILPENTPENTPESERPNIFTIYEQNIGIINPILVDKLKDIETTYPVGWFEEAVAIAVENNVRRLSYVEAILERWKTEGKDNGHKKADPTALRFQAVKMLAGTDYTEADVERMIDELKGAA